MMKSASSEHALKVFIDYNEEAVQAYEETKEPKNPIGETPLRKG